MKKLAIAAVISVTVIGGLYYSLSSPKKLEEEDQNHDHHAHQETLNLSDEQIRNLGIEVKKAEPGLLHLILNTRGKIILHPDRLVHLLPKVTGVAKDTFKNIGDPVARGDLLAILESREIADLKAEFLAALAKENQASLLFEREKRLYEKKISAEQDFLSAQAALNDAKLQVMLARQKLHSFGLSQKQVEAVKELTDTGLRFYEIRSPIKGVILNRDITKGEFISTDKVIYEIADLSKLWVEIGLYPKDLSSVKEGQTVEIIRTSDGAKGVAKIIYISPVIQEETIVSRAIAVLDNSQREWRPGTFVKVIIDLGDLKASILIPKEAVQEIDGETVVFVKTKEGFEKRAIVLGKSDSTHTEVLSGLQEGDEYASSKTFLLKSEFGKGDVEHD